MDETDNDRRESLERALRRHGLPVQVDLQEWLEPKTDADQHEH